MSNRLGGFQGTAYVGTNANQPPNWTFHDRDPNQYDSQNYSLGDLWLNTVTRNAFVLVSLEGTSSSRGQLADWVIYTGGSGSTITLTADTGVATPVSGNINILTDNLAVDTSATGDTLTINTKPEVPLVFTTDLNDVVASANRVGIFGDGTYIETDDQSSSVVRVSLVGNVVSTLTTGSGVATAASYNIDLADGIGITMSASGDTVVIAAAASVPDTFLTDSGTATPSLHALTIAGSHGINTSGSGSTVTVAINNAIVLGDLSGIAANSNALSATTGDINIAAGNLKLPAFNSAGTRGVVKFNNVAFIRTDAIDNQFVGINAGNTTLTGTNNSVFGANTLNAITTSTNNCLIGNQIMTTATSGASFNTIIGSGSYNVGIGNQNVIIGNDALKLATSSQNNTAIGSECAYNSVGPTGLTTGDNNIFIGRQAGINYTSTESDNLIIYNTGTTAESNTIRIGTSGSGAFQQNRCFIAGIRGITTGVADAVAVLIDSAGQLGTVSSSIRYKENVRNITSESDAVLHLRPVVFNYIQDASKKDHYGLIAEEVAEYLPELVVFNQDKAMVYKTPETVKYQDLPILLLASLQKQEQRIKALELALKALQGRLEGPA